MAKAEAAEQKARDARDGLAHAQAWREAARQWERAALREKSDKLRRDYTDKAASARANAESAEVSGDEDTLPEATALGSKLLN